MSKIVAIIGARPQFIKHFPFEKEAIKVFDLVTVHTGQHYDNNMSDVFFDQLGMRKPDYLLTLGGGNHGAQTGSMLIEIEKILLSESPDGVIVYGDTNSTLAGALAASKLHIPVFHVEAGLRSYNKQMPEEINRIMTDHVSDLLLVPSVKSVESLAKEGIFSGVHIVGDIMKDLVFYSKEIDVLSKMKNNEDYIYVTLHRPYNVDEPKRLKYVLEALGSLKSTLIFSAHPRTKNRLIEFNILLPDNIIIIDPQPYFENLSYLYNSSGLITDSGGMQKEAYWLEKPCTTIRSETEWVETLNGGANRLLFEDLSDLKEIDDRKCIFEKSLYGDGQSAESICHQITEYFNAQ
jgi:UDP-GlcNAc3NAcA epimerase